MILRYPLQTESGDIRPVLVSVEVIPSEVVGGHLFYEGSADIVDVVDAFTREPVELTDRELERLECWVGTKADRPTTYHAAWW